MPGTVHYDLTDHIATITLDNPKARNAFDYEMTQELRRLWNEIEANPEVRCVIVTGEGEKGAFLTAIEVDKRNPRRWTAVQKNVAFLYGHRPRHPEVWYLSPYEFVC